MKSGMPIAAAVFFAASFPAMAETISPNVAGGFYPADKTELWSTVDSMLAQAPASAVPGRIVAALVPHAGYVYSGPTAARVFKLLEGRHYNTVIVVGSGHYYPIRGAATVSAQAFATPLGTVPVDLKAVQELRKLSPLIEELPEAFRREHSIEVELPFLQRVLKDFRLVPLLMNTNNPETSKKVGEALASLLRSTGTILIVSSDLSHYPDAKTARIVDTASLNALLQAPGDPSYFWKTNRLLLERGGGELACTECGEAGVLAAANAMKILGASPHLLYYTNSGAVAGGDTERTVGYGALVWTEGAAPEPVGRLSDEERKGLLKLSRQALEGYLKKSASPERRLWDNPSFNMPAAVFVTLRRSGAPREMSLRGCIGTLEPSYPLAEAVQLYAISAAENDPRFPPVTADELPKLSIEISRLSPSRRVASHRDVHPGQGVTVRLGARSGLFLPQVWEDLPDKARFLDELCAQKAGLPADCWKDPKTEISVFDAEAFSE
jgi:AmmeMemoRadiSam system protein B/AmmeMemoRadiSam system protein A